MPKQIKTYFLKAFIFALMAVPLYSLPALASVPEGTGTGGTSTSSDLGNGCASDSGSPTNCLSHNVIVTDLNTIVNVLAGLVGIVVVGTIIAGGVQYVAAGDKAEATAGAKKRIINGLTALGAFLFIYTFLQWLIPGGVFK